MNKMIIANLEIEVIQKDIKNIHLSVHPPNGRVRLAVPSYTNEDSMRLFVISKLDWIKKQQTKFLKQERISPREYVSGESHYFLGNRYLLNVIETTGKQHVEIVGTKEMNLYMRKSSTVQQRERVMNEWYRAELKQLIPNYINKWEERMGVEVKDFGVKQMKTKWGSCNIDTQRIWINLELAKRNLRCLEYVIVHEMVHLLERHHNERFIAYMDKFIPHWRAIKSELNEKLFESND